MQSEIETRGCLWCGLWVLCVRWCVWTDLSRTLPSQGLGEFWCHKSYSWLLVQGRSRPRESALSLEKRAVLTVAECVALLSAFSPKALCLLPPLNSMIHSYLMCHIGVNSHGSYFVSQAGVGEGRRERIA